MATLLPSQRNDLFRAVERAGLSPADFRLDDGVSMNLAPPPPPRLWYRPGDQWTDYYFVITPRGPNYFEVEMSPGESVLKESYALDDWRSTLGAVDVWLGNLKRETSQDDLWSGILALPSAVPDDAPNDAFGSDEVDAIRRQMDAAKEYLKGQRLAPELLAEANAKLDALVDATARLGKRDWGMFAMGVVVDIAINAAFSGAQAQGLLDIVTGVVRGLLGGG